MRSKKMFGIAAGLFLLFLLFTAAVLLVDVQPIGPEQSEVGLATLNQWAFRCFGVHPLWEQVTNWLGVAAILTAGSFALLGAVQLIKRKGLRKVDEPILLLGAFYAALAVCYLFFECVVINYRPIIPETSLEASYPSSHAMLVTGVMATAGIAFRYLLSGRKKWRILLQSLSVLILVVTVVGRTLSGVHWLTDIIAGVLISSVLVMLYGAAAAGAAEKKRT